MDKKEQDEIFNEVVSETFENMREMLSEIELKILGVDPKKQFIFIRPIRDVINEAWQDTLNKEDSFLYPKSDP